MMPISKNADDQAVEPRIGKERFDDLPLKDEGDQPAQDEEHQHPDEKDAGRGEFGWIDVFAIGLSF